MSKLILDESQPNIVEVQVACGTLFIIIGHDTDNRIRFFFEVSHSAGGCQANLEGIAKLLTIYYNDGRLNRQKITDELFEIDCLNCHRWKGKLLGESKGLEGWSRSCPNAIAKVLRELEFKEKK